MDRRGSQVHLRAGRHLIYPAAKKWERWVEEYSSGVSPSIDYLNLPLAPHGWFDPNAPRRCRGQADAINYFNRHMALACWPNHCRMNSG
jgi:hypothetical protein